MGKTLNIIQNTIENYLTNKNKVSRTTFLPQKLEKMMLYNTRKNFGLIFAWLSLKCGIFDETNSKTKL